MRKLLFISFFLLSCLTSQAQHEYTIEGHVEGVKDGTLVSLFLLDGNVGSTVATDSIRNGNFFFKRNAGESGLDNLSLSLIHIWESRKRIILPIKKEIP